MNDPSKTTVVVLGASPNPERYSNKAMKLLIKHGYQVKGIAQKKFLMPGADITDEPKIFPQVHTVTLYLSPQNQKQYYDYILTLSPSRVIFNPGTENPELQQLLQQHHIPHTEACTLVLLQTGQF